MYAALKAAMCGVTSLSDPAHGMLAASLYALYRWWMGHGALHCTFLHQQHTCTKAPCAMQCMRSC